MDALVLLAIENSDADLIFIAKAFIDSVLR